MLELPQGVYRVVQVVDEERAHPLEPTPAELRRIIRYVHLCKQKRGFWPALSGPLPGRPRLCVLLYYTKEYWECYRLTL